MTNNKTPSSSDTLDVMSLARHVGTVTVPCVFRSFAFWSDKTMSVQHESSASFFVVHLLLGRRAARFSLDCFVSSGVDRKSLLRAALRAVGGALLGE